MVLERLEQQQRRWARDLQVECQNLQVMLGNGEHTELLGNTLLRYAFTCLLHTHTATLGWFNHCHYTMAWVYEDTMNKHAREGNFIVPLKWK